MLEPALKILISYLLGSVIGALWVGRILGHVDIRTLGSGNAGGTNALRTQGWSFAALVVIIDVGKGALAAGWVPGLALSGTISTAGSAPWLQVGCAAAAVVGHVFPIYHGFRGGKGAATLAGALLVVFWPALVALAVTWLICVSLTGFVGLATMLGTVCAAAYTAGSLGLRSPVFLFTLLMAGFIVWTHRSNITRMITGTENRTVKLMLLRPRYREGSGSE